MKRLSDWLLHLEALHPQGQAGIELGLERVERVKAELAQRQTCPLITVGGTNGKGSTAAYLEHILAYAGYRTGCYTSPHLLDYRERVRIDRQPVSEDALCAAFARVEAARLAAGSVPLTYFEFGTLAAWEAFTAANLDAIILEVGLGGRLDAVNVYAPDAAIVTGVALDHTDWLGADRESIGYEKAGIFRAGKPAICADAAPPQSLLDHAAAIGADLRRLGKDFGYVGDRMQWTWWGRRPASGAADAALVRRSGLANPGLRGAQQLNNAAAALAALDCLKAVLPVEMQAIRRGLIEIELAGRFQVLPGRPCIVLDVAHNPQAVAALAANLGNMGFFAKTHVVLATLADKDFAGALPALAGKVDCWHLATLAVPRGGSAASLAQTLDECGIDGARQLYPDPAAALAAAREAAGENDRIVVFGSFYTVAAAMRALKENP